MISEYKFVELFFLKYLLIIKFIFDVTKPMIGF